MGKYSIALALFLSASAVDSFHNLHPVSIRHLRQKTSTASDALNGVERRVSTSSSFPDGSNESSLGDTLNSVTNAAKDSISQVVSDFPDTDEAEIARKQRQVGNRVKTYSATLPLASKPLEGQAPLLSMGFRLGQIESGRTFSDTELDMDTLEYTTSGNERIDELGLVMKRVDGEFRGLVVSYVSEGSAAWTAGVRVGDILKTTSATIGSNLWPKSTLDGVRSAVSSRKATSKSVEFEFQRLGEALDNEFELTLTRPIGIELRETQDGFVEVSGFTENAPTLVQYAVKVGDRVLAVESSLGGKMWPVSTVDGVISAVTGRLPGQTITLRFERVQEDSRTGKSTTTTASPALSVTAQKEATPINTAVATNTPVQQKELLKRCRDIIRRYTATNQMDDKFVGKFSVPGLVADKVVDAIASAGSAVDRVTLSMIMEAYLSCGQSQKAIETFEASVGVSADGSAKETETTIEGKEGVRIVPNIEALDVFTVSALLKAHAKKGDLNSVQRVLFALKGKDYAAVDDIQAASWPGTFPEGTLKPDTRCYNTVLSAAADSSATDGLIFALEMFERMNDEKSKRDSTAVRNLATYNIMINALANAGRFEEAIDLFYIAKKLGLKLDKYTYTALVKAAVTGDDAEELLYDMREQGVVADAVMYNTLIKSLCDQRNFAMALKIVNQMEEAGVAPNSRTYGLLMKGLIESNKPGAALTLFETACTEPRTVPLTENVYLYTTAITAAAAQRDHERALELLSRMSSLGLKPSLKTLTALLGACLSSEKPDLAVDVYRQIANPDAYATTQGIRALSENGNFEEALSLVTENAQQQNRHLNGKQEMLCYKELLENSLAAGDFVFARKALDTIFASGGIPSKAIYQAIFDSMQLFLSTSNGRLEEDPRDDLNSSEKFQFLLYVLDSVGKRNLPCEGPLYSAILSYGFRLGGLAKKVASLVVIAKTATFHGLNEKKLIDECDVTTEQCIVSSWSDLFDSYDEIKDSDLKQPAALPRLKVRIGSKDVVNILKAERNVSFKKRALL